MVFKSLINTILFLVLFIGNSNAKDKLNIYTEIIDNENIRIILSNKNIPEFKLKLDNYNLQISLNQSFDISIQDIKDKKFILETNIDKDNKIINFTLNQSFDYTFNKFISDEFTGLDLGAKKRKEIVAPTLESDKLLSLKQIDQKNTENNLIKINVIENKEQDIVQWIFPWQEQVAASSFYRAGYLWIIFDKSINFDAEELLKTYNLNIEEFEQLPNHDYTIIRLKQQEQHSYKMYKVASNWVLMVARYNKNLTPLNKITEYKTEASKGIFFPVNKVGKPITIIDPLVGDELVIVPFFNDDYGNIQDRSFIGFNLLQSIQGFVVNKLSDDIMVKVIKPGIEVIVPYRDKNRLSAHQPNLTLFSDQKSESLYASHLHSLLPFTKFKTKYGKDFLEMNHNVQHQVITSLGNNRHDDLFYLAQFLFSQELYRESLGILDDIQRYYHDYNKINEVKFLHSAALFMVGKYFQAQEKIQDLDKQYFTDAQKSEIDLWQGAINLALGASNVAYNYLKAKSSFLNDYPMHLQHKLAMLELEQAINKEQLDMAAEIINQINDEQLNIDIKNSLNYYRGMLYVKKHDIDNALEVLVPISEDITDRYNRVRSNMAIARLMLNSKAINREEAIERLDKLRYTWRGDKLEVDLLLYLADLQYEQGNYIESLRIWRQLTTHFPRFINILSITARMSQVFVSLFKDDQYIKTMSDFEAINLYYEFRELTPIGKEGDRITREFAYKLLNMDLLDRAAALLTHQVKYRLTGEEREVMINKVATIHLMNKNPESALEIIDMGHVQEIKPELNLQKKLIKAKALSDMDQDNEALQIISELNSLEAENLRIEILWKIQEWQSLKALLEKRLEYLINYQGVIVFNDNNVIKLAVSYSMLDNNLALKTLYNNIKGLQEQYPELIDKIKFLSENREPINYLELDKTLGIENMRTFLDYLKEQL